ncbi:hypothetical protein IJT93_09950 [bacterium]|nr:hypothetical protein [bacterium]
MEANIVIMKCSSTNGFVGVRVQKMEDGDWHRTWAFKINPKTANREGYDSTMIHGSLCCTEEFPGCPYCGNMSLYYCCKCKHIVCYNGTDTHVVCPWCGYSAALRTAEYLNLSAGRF